MNPDLKWYADYFVKEILAGNMGQFTGSMSFQVNFRQGNIGNMNVGINQSVKMEGFNGQFSKTVQKT